MPVPTTQHIVTCLTGGDLPRVWSLLVTVFGDLAQDEGASLSGVSLGHLTHAIGIKPEALRVALHRLRKDGWIESEKQGRESHHRLTEWGRAQSAKASPRIYGAAPDAQTAWLSVYDRSVAPDEGVWLAPNIRLTASECGVAGVYETRLHTNDPLPDWMRNKVCDSSLRTHAAVFSTRLSDCTALLENSPSLADLDVAILRVLVVHGWRRIVLKAPILPDYVYPDDWAGPSCREKVSALLDAYPRVALSNTACAN